MFDDKVILIAGGAGVFGKLLTEILHVHFMSSIICFYRASEYAVKQFVEERRLVSRNFEFYFRVNNNFPSIERLL